MTLHSNRFDPIRPHQSSLSIHIPESVVGKLGKPISMTSHLLSVRMLADSTQHVVGNNHPLGMPVVQRTLPNGSIERGEFLSTGKGDGLFLAEGVRLQPNGLCSAGGFIDGMPGENLLDHGLIIHLQPNNSQSWSHLSTGYHSAQSQRGIQLIQSGLKRTPNALLSGHFEWEEDRGHILMFGHMLYPDGSGCDILAGDPMRMNASPFLKAAMSMYPEAVTMRNNRNTPDKPLETVKSIFTRELNGMQTGQTTELQFCIQSHIKAIEQARDKRAVMVAVMRAIDAVEPYIRQMTPPDSKTCRHLAGLHNYLGVVASRGELYRA
ncbi:MAG TPA: hypothetical protein VGE55_11680 [Limnobacter sp.]|uniref:hypothetical protein n=1 Tax=Limnobacter sp. TaxID=2003368 RepID=UPI002EDA48CB